ncbi:hypothetical protein Sjap_024766 [Stephania japonica]|uniref:Regulator of MON1-CCZ1 complex N-terminal domain-containing protein n=1 Tax=Stephania japonica TaxID=461633 RepID=A0AAP0HLU0_9MAGN
MDTTTTMFDVDRHHHSPLCLIPSIGTSSVSCSAQICKPLLLLQSYTTTTTTSIVAKGPLAIRAGVVSQPVKPDDLCHAIDKVISVWELSVVDGFERYACFNNPSCRSLFGSIRYVTYVMESSNQTCFFHGTNEAKDYGACVAAKVSEVERDMCLKEFLALSACMQNMVYAWKTAHSPYTTPSVDSIGEGPVLSIHYSLDGKVIEIQWSNHEIQFVNRGTGDMFMQRCGSESESILGFFKTDCPSCDVFEMAMTKAEANNKPVLGAEDTKRDYANYESQNKEKWTEECRLNAEVQRPKAPKYQNKWEYSLWTRHLPFVMA